MDQKLGIQVLSSPLMSLLCPSISAYLFYQLELLNLVPRLRLGLTCPMNPSPSSLSPTPPLYTGFLFYCTSVCTTYSPLGPLSPRALRLALYASGIHCWSLLWHKGPVEIWDLIPAGDPWILHRTKKERVLVHMLADGFNHLRCASRKSYLLWGQWELLKQRPLMAAGAEQQLRIDCGGRLPCAVCRATPTYRLWGQPLRIDCDSRDCAVCRAAPTYRLW